MYYKIYFRDFIIGLFLASCVSLGYISPAKISLLIHIPLVSKRQLLHCQQLRHTCKSCHARTYQERSGPLLSVTVPAFRRREHDFARAWLAP